MVFDTKICESVLGDAVIVAVFDCHVGVIVCYASGERMLVYAGDGGRFDVASLEDAGSDVLIHKWGEG